MKQTFAFESLRNPECNRCDVLKWDESAPLCTHHVFGIRLKVFSTTTQVLIIPEDLDVNASTIVVNGRLEVD